VHHQSLVSLVEQGMQEQQLVQLLGLLLWHLPVAPSPVLEGHQITSSYSSLGLEAGCPTCFSTCGSET